MCVEQIARGGLASIGHGPLMLLPRPWMKIDAEDVLERQSISLDGAVCTCGLIHRAGETLYVNGYVQCPGRATRPLGYWHQVAQAREVM